MDTTQIIINVIFIAAIIWVGFILREQGKSQTAIISSLEKYMSIIDIDKILQYDKYREESAMIKADNHIKTEFKKKFINEDFHKLYKAEWNKVMTVGVMELQDFTFQMLLTFDKSDREKIFEKTFPKTKDTLRLVLEEYEKDNIA